MISYVVALINTSLNCGCKLNPEGSALVTSVTFLQAILFGDMCKRYNRNDNNSSSKKKKNNNNNKP
jgi:hypothetical protein